MNEKSNKTILLTEMDFENTIIKMRLANLLSNEFRVILLTFVDSKILQKYVSKYKNEKIRMCYIQDIITKYEKDNISFNDLNEIEDYLAFPVQKFFFADPEFYKIYLKNPRKAYKIFYLYFKAFQEIIKKENIDAHLCQAEDALHNLLPHFICKAKDIRSILFRVVPYHGLTLTEDFFGHYSSLNKVDNQPKINTVREGEVERYFSLVAENKGYSDAFLGKKREIPTTMEKIEKLFCYLHYIPRDKNNPYRFWKINRWISKLITTKIDHVFVRLAKIYTPIKDRENYFFFPLHWVDDAQIRLKAPEYYNQFEVVKSIALNIPSGTVLYIKEHPFYKGAYSIKNLMEVSKIPNIRLIDPKVSSWHLLKNELATITINSTAGYEGLFMRKPCFCLANAFYDAFSGVTKIKRIDELKNLLTEEYIDKKKREIDEGFKDDLRSLLSISCHGGIGFGYAMLEPKNVNKIIKLLNSSLEKYGKD